MSYSPRHRERRRLAARDKHAATRAVCRHRATYPRERGAKITDDAFRATVERMTNRSRNRWARAGYPGLRHRDVEPLRAFVAPERV